MKKTYSITTLLLFFVLIADAQEPGISCHDGIPPHNITVGKEVHQSSSYANSLPTPAIDGITTGTWAEGNITRTVEQMTPWWEVNLDDSYMLDGLEIHYAEEFYEDGFQDYYILFSAYPFQSNSLLQELASPLVDYVYVESSLPNGANIPIAGKQAQYIRIQMAGIGTLSLKEIIASGWLSPEICDSGNDDDCDGAIDCEDSDCYITIYNVSTTNPSCPICNDGIISIQAFSRSPSLDYSIDGGNTFKSCSAGTICRFENLPEGIYSIVVTNGVCPRTINGPIELRGPAGRGSSDCENGDLEEGTLENWEIDGAVRIIQSRGFFDSQIPEVNGNYDALGTYLLMLGDGFDGANNDIAEYCFIVDQDNSDFNFLYAMVMEDPNDDNHTEDIRPFFKYELILNGDENNPIVDNKVISNDPFLVVDEGIYKYKSWTCVSYDLSQYEGQEICVKFTVRDCTLGDHEGHAYIDGLCTDLDALTPNIEILGNQIYCQNQNVNLFVTGGGFNTYQWTVGKIDANGTAYEVHQFPSTIGYNPRFSNVLETYTNESGFVEECIEYFATLFVTGECGDATATINFSRACANYSVEYCESIVICNGRQELTLIGDIDCEGCTYNWQPANYFYDNTIALPKIKGFEWNDALDRMYSVIVTTPEGCTFEREVNVIERSGYAFNFTHTEDRCEHHFTFTLDFDFDVDPSIIQSEVNDIPNSITDIPVFNAVNSDQNTLVFEVTLDKDRANTLDLEYTIDIDLSTFDNVCQIGADEECDEAFHLGLYNTSIFSRPWKMFLPNAFSPNNNGNNDVFRAFMKSPIDAACSGSTENSSIYFMRLDIFDRWGGHVYGAEEEIPIDAYGGLSGDEVAWDGFVRCGFSNNVCDDASCNTGEICYSNGEPVVHQSGVYAFILAIKSCTTRIPDCPNDPNPCDTSNGEHCSDGATGERIISGDVTITL